MKRILIIGIILSIIAVASYYLLEMYQFAKGVKEDTPKFVEFLHESNSTEANRNADSIELTNLIRKVYEWHETKRLNDFPYQFDEQQDSIFIGIDWDKYQKNIELFKQTNFFSTDFLHKHKNIALTLDTSIKKADITWRNINDGIPLWESGADDWCGCQDYPDNYWNFLTIDSLRIKDEYANFCWNWDKEFPHDYKVTARKENGQWKINSLEEVNNYFSVEHYDKLMNKNN